MAYKSIEEIIEKFNLLSNKYEFAALRNELKKLLANAHPDKNGGDFASDEDKLRYESLQEAIDFIDSNTSKNLIPINQITDIVKAITSVMQPSREETVARNKREIKLEIHSDIRSRYINWKIGSGTFAAICAGIIAFSKDLTDNPLVGELFKTPIGTSMAATLLFSSAILFVFTWLREQKDEQRKEWLFSEEGKLHLLRTVISRARRIPNNKYLFSFNDFVSLLNSPRDFMNDENQNIPFRLSRTLFSARLSLSTAEQLAKFHLDDLENRGVIQRHTEKSVIKYYTIEENILDDILHKYS